MRNQLTTIAKKLKNLRRGRQSNGSLLEELRAMRVSYSQFGEDLVILNHFLNFEHSTGRFIDVGAFHPFKYSNTMLLSKLGWRGINIDCDQAKMSQFDKLRPGDENVCAAVADASRDMIWIEYPSGVTNRLADSGEKDLLSLCGETPLKITPVKAMTLTDIVEQSAFRGQHFHYLNIDCEGQDLSVLTGLNFSRYQPELISVEALTKAARPELTDFLGHVGYELTDIVHVTLFFKKRGSVA
jgi:methyltransferase FkbM-like protein